MRQLTKNELANMTKDDAKVSAWILNNSHYRAGFIAGLEYQDKRIEALEAMLTAWEAYNDGLITRKELALKLVTK